VQTALTATQTALKIKPNSPSGTANGLKNETVGTFAMIRPPGHHATTNLCGGYCYLNNVVICASYFLRQNTHLKCVIVDVDFHHGNGVEEILQRERTKDWSERCQYLSLHAHPEYPYYTTHLPTPLPKSVTAKEYLDLLRQKLDGVRGWCEEETLLLVSLGLDTFYDDPIGGFAGFKEQNDYFDIGLTIGEFVGSVGARGCFLLEGGYVVEKLGECVEGVLRGYMRGLEHT
jgi:acetoin utilization deacetylase AcuC-like enzyme